MANRTSAPHAHLQAARKEADAALHEFDKHHHALERALPESLRPLWGAYDTAEVAWKGADEDLTIHAIAAHFPAFTAAILAVADHLHQGDSSSGGCECLGDME